MRKYSNYDVYILVFTVLITLCYTINLRLKLYKQYEFKRDYQIEINEDTLILYDEDRKVGTIKISDRLNKLILKDNS